METIDILGYHYRVVFERDPIVYDSDVCEGYCNNVTQVIQVAADLAPDRKRDVMMHEIIHAIYHIIGDRDEWNQEKVCDCVGHGLTYVFKKNVQWLNWFFG